jgi:hypothetical protein
MPVPADRTLSGRGTMVAAGGIRRWGGTVAMLLAVAGCGPAATIVQGVVTLDGEPVAAASVQFYPVGREGQPAGTTTDERGRYRARVSAVPLRVVVSKRKITGYKEDPFDPVSSPMPVLDELLPPRYAATATTPLTIDPAAGRATTLDVPLMTAP